MNGATRAAFTFEQFRIAQFSFTEFNVAEAGLKGHFDPYGLYQASDGNFAMRLDFAAQTESDEKEVIKLSFLAQFRFQGVVPATLEDIPPYFYGNAIAIVFPYLRAFVTTLTAQANLTPLILPVFNLTGLEPVFRQQTTLAD